MPVFGLNMNTIEEKNQYNHTYRISGKGMGPISIDIARYRGCARGYVISYPAGPALHSLFFLFIACSNSGLFRQFHREYIIVTDLFRYCIQFGNEMFALLSFWQE